MSQHPAESPYGRAALEAAAERALAIAREHRSSTEPAIVALGEPAGILAALIAEQFGDADMGRAGRIVMATAEFIGDEHTARSELDVETVVSILAFAAEQLVREAGEQR